MPLRVRVYACRQYSPLLDQWEKCRNKYTLEEIASLPNAEPIMDEWEEVDRPTAEEQRRLHTGVLWRD